MYYKVVTKVFDDYASSQCHDNVWCIYYVVGKWAEADKRMKILGYGPLVFNDLERARRFAMRYAHGRKQYIFECSVEGERETPTLYLESSIYYLYNYGTSRDNCNPIPTPNGTIMVDHMRLDKMVGYYNRGEWVDVC